MFRFVEFTLDTAEQRLARGHQVVRLPPKTLDLLITRVSDAGRLMTEEQLLGRVWADTFVEEGILTVQMSGLRKALGDHGSFIETVPRSGYRFIAPVTVVRPPSDTSARETRPARLHELSEWAWADAERSLRRAL